MILVKVPADIPKLKPNIWSTSDMETIRGFGWSVQDADEFCSMIAEAAVKHGFELVRIPRFSSSKELLYVQVYERCPCKTYGKGEYDTFHFAISWRLIGSTEIGVSLRDTILWFIDGRLENHVQEDEEKARKLGEA